MCIRDSKDIHGLQDAAVGLSEGRLPLRELAILQDAHRLGEAQLIGDVYKRQVWNQPSASMTSAVASGSL